MAEVELKLAVPSDALAALRERLAQFGRGRTRRVDSLYFDTADLRLASVGAAVRLRRIGARWVQTVKIADGDAALSTRGEWELPARPGEMSWARFPLDARRAVLALLQLSRAPRLEPQFRTRFVRTRWDVRIDGAEVEVALDVGEIVAGDGRRRRRQALCELELELKTGRAEVLPKLARRIVLPRDVVGLPLLPQPLSKAARGRLLAQGATLKAVKADRSRITGSLRPTWTAAQALRAVVMAGSDVLWANVHGAHEHDEPEFVHQARVALRRMRSAVRLLRKDVDFPAALIEELRWMGQALGAARDADVLLFETLPDRFRNGSARIDAALSDRVFAAARKRRGMTRERMRRQLHSARCAAAGLSLMTWAFAAQAASAGKRKQRSMRALAPKRLQSAYQKLVAAAKFFAALSPLRQHRVRILAKRLRYSIDTFATCLPAAPAARFNKAVEKVQDALGAVNDAQSGARAIAAWEALSRVKILAEAGDDPASALKSDADHALSDLFAMPVPWRARSAAGRRAIG